MIPLPADRIFDLQAHGQTADIDRPIRCELKGDDIALRTAIQHPEGVRELVLVSAHFWQDGWCPKIVASMR